MRELPAEVAELAAAVPPVDDAAMQAALQRHARLAKPPGSLGRLEEVGATLAGIAGTCPPPEPERPVVLVAAADHGVHAAGVTPWPQHITAAMVDVMGEGRAAVNALAAVGGVRVRVLDVGVAHETATAGSVVRRRVRSGTGDLSREPAMTSAEAVAAIRVGADVTRDLIEEGADLVAVGDMGIANTTASACLVAALTGAGAGDVTGPGAATDGMHLARKTAVVAGAVAALPRDAGPFTALTHVGGLEHAALAGAMLAAGAARVPVVLDGLITNAAALVAVGIAPALRPRLIAGHRSTEPGATVALAALGLQPLLDLGLRLGEGTGAVMAIPLVTGAAAVLSGTATIDEVIAPR